MKKITCHMKAKTIVVDLVIEMTPASSSFSDIVKRICPKKLKIPKAKTRKRFSHDGRQNPFVDIRSSNVKTQANNPKLQITTEWCKSRRILMIIIAFAVKIALAIAANGPQK